jgi:hypothetical protein
MLLDTRDSEICAMFLVLCKPLWGTVMKTLESGSVQSKFSSVPFFFDF